MGNVKFPAMSWRLGGRGLKWLKHEQLLTMNNCQPWTDPILSVEQHYYHARAVLCTNNTSVFSIVSTILRFSNDEAPKWKSLFMVVRNKENLCWSEQPCMFFSVVDIPGFNLLRNYYSNDATEHCRNKIVIVAEQHHWQN